ncbi:MAG: restriction endonuclease subunit S [Polaromonas sp.]
MSELPQGWAATQLGALLSSIVGGGTPSKSNAEYFQGNVPFMTVKDMHARFITDTQDHITQEALEDSASTLIPADTLIVASRMSLGKIARPTVAVAINQDLKALFPHKGVDKTYLEYAWRSKESAIQGMGTGTTVKGIRLEDIRGLDIALAPTAEQTRIANKLDALFSRIRACNDRFDSVPALLKRFRQTVLDAALNGTLVESEEVAVEKVPKVQISAIAAVGTRSTPLRSNGQFFASTGTPWVTSSATSNSVIAGASEFVTPAGVSANRLKIYPKGTLLVAMYGEGKTRGQVAQLGIEAAINQACAAVVVDGTKALPAYVKLALQTNYLSMRELAEGGSQPNLNLSKVKQFEIPLPSLAAQAEIVRRVEALFAIADRVEASCTNASGQAQRLNPLVLAKAFRGELLPQDPRDERANELLDRIGAAPPQKRVANAAVRPARKHQSRGANATRSSDEPMDAIMKLDSVPSNYLAAFVAENKGVNAKELWQMSKLSIDDFYVQLSGEIGRHLLKVDPNNESRICRIAAVQGGQS